MAGIGTRFIDTRNGVIFDNNSGLYWYKEDIPISRILKDIRKDSISVQELIDYVSSLVKSGYSDWRIPSKNEISTISIKENQQEEIDLFLRSVDWYILLDGMTSYSEIRERVEDNSRGVRPVRGIYTNLAK